MKMFMLFSTIYLVFLPTSLSVLVPQASVIDWTSHKDNDRLNAHLPMHSSEQNETDLRNIDHTPNLNSKNSNDSGNNNEALHSVLWYYLIFFQPYSLGNVTKWKKSNYEGEAVGIAHDDGINRYENVTKGGVSDENIKMLNKKGNFNYPQWYVIHVPSHKMKNTTNGASNKKQYSDIVQEKSGPTDDSIFFQPYPVGNVSKWQKSNYDKEAIGNAHDKGINLYENFTKGKVSDENIKIPNKKGNFNYALWYVIHVPSHKNKNATNGAFNKEQYSGIIQEKSGPTDDSIFFQPYPVGNVSKWQKSNYDKEAIGNAHDKGINLYENFTKGKVSDENIKIPNKKGNFNYALWYVIHVPSHKKKNATNGAFNKEQYSGIAKRKSGPIDDSHVKGDIVNSEGKYLGTVELKGKSTDVSELNKMYLKIFHFSNKQNLKLNSESEKNNEIPIFASLSAKSFNSDGKNGEFNKDSKTSSKTAFDDGYIFDSNEKSRESTGEVVQPDEKEHKTNYHTYFFHYYFGEYPKNMTTENTYGLKYEAPGETEERNGQFQKNDTRESRSRKKWIGEGHDEGTHTGYFIISDHADKQASFPRQKRQIKTNKESEGREQGKGSIILDDIRSEKPISNTSKGNGTAIEKLSNNGSSMDSDLVRKLQNSSPIRGKAPTKDTENKISKENGTHRFHRNSVTSDKVNSSNSVAKSPNAFPKPDSNNPFHSTQSKGNPKEAMNFKVEYQKDIKSTAEGKTVSENVSGHTKIAGETAVGIAGNQSLLEEKITKVKHSAIKNDEDKTRNRNGTTMKPIQMAINGSSGDTQIAEEMFSNNSSNNSFKIERSLRKRPFLRIDFKADRGAKEQTVNQTRTLIKDTVKPEEISRTDNLSIAEEKKGQEVMYRSHEKHVNATLKDETPAFNISKENTPDKEKQVPLNQTMMEVTETANVSTQESVIHIGVKNNEEATHHGSDSHKFNDGTQTTSDQKEILSEKVAGQKTLVPLHHTDSTPVADVKNIEAVAYRNNDYRNPLETVTNETQVDNKSNTSEAKESNQATLNDNVERNSSGSHLIKEVALNVATTEQSQNHENTTTTELMTVTETQTHSGPMDDSSHVNRQNTSDITNYGKKQESLFSPKQLKETKIANQGMLDNDRRNTIGGNLNETDGAKLKRQQHMVPEQMEIFTDNSNFERFIFPRKDVSWLTTKQLNVNVTTESVINNPQELTPTKQMQSVNRITNMTGWFERKQRNVEKETSETETVRPSILDKTKDDFLTDNAEVSNKDATNFEIQPRITTTPSRNNLQNTEKSTNNTNEASPTVSDNSGDHVITETDTFPLDHRHNETAVAELSSPASVLNITYEKTEQMARETPVYAFNKNPLQL